MKRDMDLVRKIVLFLEDQPQGFAPKILLSGHSEEQVGYHIYLMIQAGLLSGTNVSNSACGSPQGFASALTWAGHEFAAEARSDTVWNKAKAVIGDKVGTASIGVLVEVLKQQAKQMLGLA